MSEQYFIPWMGKNYEHKRILIVSESAYDWPDDEGVIRSPQPSHPTDSISWNKANFGRTRYFDRIHQVICGAKRPSFEQMSIAWERYAYTIFVQRSVGVGAGVRPTSDLWEDASTQFKKLLERLRPRKVIITGVDMWNRMPECTLRLLDDLQAYRLNDGDLVWCLALPHPANRVDGFNWENVSESVHLFEAAEFPLRWPLV